ncbi:MAG: hypothetical protein U5K00_09040 [Melioribacteraceae bacterium]|nr:hypothetical protein [Melioribacteraceae bacterium]
MKSIIKIIVVIVFSITLYSQSGSINNTLGSGGLFTIKDGSTTFFSLDQSDGELTLSGSVSSSESGSGFSSRYDIQGFKTIYTYLQTFRRIRCKYVYRY